MHDWVRKEIELLKRQFPDLKHGDQLDWVLIPELVLPPGRFNKDATKLLFRISVGYPQTGPDNFFVDSDLRLKGGSTPPAFNAGSQSSSGPAPIEGDWGWFSWHPQAWRPAATIEGGDNLVVFVRGVNLCLRGEEAS
jgi:hypothetical protein